LAIEFQWAAACGAARPDGWGDVESRRGGANRLVRPRRQSDAPIRT